MNRTDRVASVLLFLFAAIAWLALGVTFLTLDPTGNPAVLLAGALLLGVAVSLTVAPLFWTAGFALRGRGIAYRGDWWRAARRGLLAGLAVTLLVLLRGQGLLTPPLALFVVAMAVVVELTLWLRR